MRASDFWARVRGRALRSELRSTNYYYGEASGNGGLRTEVHGDWVASGALLGGELRTKRQRHSQSRGTRGS